MVNVLIGNFLLRKMFRGNLNKPISLAEIASFRFSQKISLKRKLTCTLSDLRQNKEHRAIACIK